jgi:hypothetical protein
MCKSGWSNRQLANAGKHSRKKDYGSKECANVRTQRYWNANANCQAKEEKSGPQKGYSKMDKKITNRLNHFLVGGWF